MVSCKCVYEPQEDSTLLEKHVRKLAFGKVLDVGTGSGIQAIAAAHSNKVESVIATDIHKGVIDYCRKTIKNRKIKFVASDLFGIFEKSKPYKNIKFDTIIFNPPYLPQKLDERDIALEGGKKGYEVIERFLRQASRHLSGNGLILMIFSSFTNKEKVEQLIKNNLFEFEELEKLHIFFEDIYAYFLKKSDLLKELEKNEIADITFFAQGHRGILYRGNYKRKNVIIKTKNPQSQAHGRIANEAKWLKILNKRKIGPKLIFSKENYFAYEFIDGEFIAKYLQKKGKKEIKNILKKVFGQMFVMDKLKVDKEEMHHPYKHIIIKNKNPFLIDFERVHYSESPKNVTQFCQFITSNKMQEILKDGLRLDKEKFIQLAKVYKRNQNKANLEKIIDAI